LAIPVLSSGFYYTNFSNVAVLTHWQFVSWILQVVEIALLSAYADVGMKIALVSSQYVGLGTAKG